jgi:branched-chain amino acid transport system ATP-binding protein
VAENAPILAAEGVSLRFGGVRALTDVSFHVKRGEIFSIIGPNGAGKTSMVNCVSGRYRPTEGASGSTGRTSRGSAPTGARGSASGAPSRTWRCSGT